MMMKTTNSIQISTVKLEARELLNGKWIRTVCVSAILLFSFLTVTYITGLFGTGTSTQIMGFIAGLILQLLYSLLFDGGFLYFLHLYEGQEAAPGDVFALFRMQPDRFLITGLIKSGAGLAASLPLLAARFGYERNPSFWRIFLIIWILIGGALLAAFRMAASMTPFLLIEDSSMGPLDALRESFALTKGFRLKLFLLLLSFLPFWLLGAFTAGIGYLWVLPYCMTSVTGFRLKLKEKTAVS